MRPVRAAGGTATWRLSGPRGDEEVSVRGRADTDEFAFARAVVLAGFGIALAQVTLLGPLVETGELERVLPRYARRSAPVHVVWPSRRFEPAAVTLFATRSSKRCPGRSAPHALPEGGAVDSRREHPGASGRYAVGMDPVFDTAIARAAEAIRRADAIVVGAGAGMGVDSGLPDFRGDRGFWKAYPPYERLGMTFIDAANPEHFEADPAFGWGFYGHRLALYRATIPHPGFTILRRWIEERELASFVYTSNVDGQFQKAGFDEERVVEVHGSIHQLQCATPCAEDIWRNRETVDVDESTMRARTIVRCPRCGGVARPNILMFGDCAWLPGRTHAQQARFDAFLAALRDRRVVAIELGAGTAIPSVRLRSEWIAQRPNAALVRVNPREPQAPPGAIAIATGALAALEAIDERLAG